MTEKKKRVTKVKKAAEEKAPAAVEVVVEKNAVKSESRLLKNCSKYDRRIGSDIVVRSKSMIVLQDDEQGTFCWTHDNKVKRHLTDAELSTINYGVELGIWCWES